MFRHEDRYGEEIGNRHFVRCSLRDVDWTEATSRGATFTECSFSGVRLNASRHVNSAFTRCVFTRCLLVDATFTGCKLVGSTFTECELRPLCVDGGEWSFVSLARADLRGSDLSALDPTAVDPTGAVIDPQQALQLAATLGFQVR